MSGVALAWTEDHPRVCGEQWSAEDLAGSISGSPPRVRGTGFDGSNTLTVKGITPACAGNRSSFLYADRGLGDHPRVCGEQLDITRAYRPLSGSPPRVRGTAKYRYMHPVSRRITPACAGNRQSQPVRKRTQQDHPRVCGEQPAGAGPGPWGRGSPPRVRGTVLPAIGKLERIRITPACAGNSLGVRHGNGV